MITFADNVFQLDTKQTSYVFRIAKFGHPESVYYGDKIVFQDVGALLLKHTIQIGTTVAYDASDEAYSLDTLSLEYSGVGKGDFRHPPAEIKMPDGTFVCDFTYRSHRIFDGCAKCETLPTACGKDDECQTAEIVLQDAPNRVTLLLYYTVYPETDVITRRAVLQNENENPLVIRRLMSMMLDLNLPFPMKLLTLDGGWIKEAHCHTRPLGPGLYVNESISGSSGNRHNPGIMLAEQTATEDYGKVYGFNLVYSGNHYEAVDVGNQGLIRVMSGINPHCFEWPLAQGERFETPEAVLTYSGKGFNPASGQFHDFINRHIVRGDYQNKERPILFNNWESSFFKFTQGRLLRLARRARSLGVELFVLDDGWFGKRDSDKTSLGDYTPNPRKFRRGLRPLIRRINRMGLSFGIWVEPEMVNEDSDLFRAHPEYAVRLPDRTPSYGRNQLVLDLCNPKVRDYIVSNLRSLLENHPIAYVKWDMNRSITDMYSPCLKQEQDMACQALSQVMPCKELSQGMFHHRYILGLYEVMARVFGDKPQILLEGCASGGNRFDLGILCFAQQIWASDDTDPVERLAIQKGLSYFYPLSAIGAHVSSAPHQQTLRNTPLSSRFNTACFGDLGYEMDLNVLSYAERKEIRQQIAFYKERRRIFQYGTFYRFDPKKPNKEDLLCVSEDRGEAVAGHFQTLSSACDSNDILPLRGLDETRRYMFRTVPQGLSIKRFGLLINFLLPFRIRPEGFLIRTVDRFWRMPDCIETYAGTGNLLHAGVRLANPFIGTGYNPHVQMAGDFGSYLYDIREAPVT